MNHVERFRTVMDFQAVDRLPMWEWAMWWDKTIERWKGEGLPDRLNRVFDIHDYFGLDPYMQFWFSTTDPTIEATQHHVEGIVANMDDYLAVRPRLFPSHDRAIRSMRRWAERQARGEAVVWITLEGCFWFPAHLDGLYENQPGFLRSAGADPSHQRGFARFQSADSRTGPKNVRAHVRHHRRRHVVQQGPHDLRAAL